MQFTLEKLNQQTAGTEFADQEPLTILKATAREPQLAAVFNYASMAHNNAFFFEGLANTKNEEQAEEANADEDRIPPRLKIELAKHFSSIETLRREFLITATGMFGPGFVWLVKNAHSTELRILATYLAGTPYTAGHWRRQGVDMNTQGVGAPEVAREWIDRVQAGAGATHAGRFVAQNQTAPGGTDVVPILCLNTWEHVWLRDYGVGAGGHGGKRQYVQDWWRCIDWNRAEALANLIRPDVKRK